MKFYLSTFILFFTAFINNAHAEDLTTVVEKGIKEQIDIDLNSGLYVNLDRWQILVDKKSEKDDYQPLEQDAKGFNEFKEADKTAAKNWALSVVNVFLASAYNQLEQKILLADIDDLMQSQIVRIEKKSIEAYQKQFSSSGAAVTSSLLNFEQGLTAAMMLCTSLSCIESLTKSSSSLISFAYDLESRSKIARMHDDQFISSVLNLAYSELLTTQPSPGPHVIALSTVIKEFLSVWQGEKSAHDARTTILGDMSNYAHYNLERAPFKITRKWEFSTMSYRVVELGALINAARIQRSAVTIPPKMVAAKKLTITCELTHPGVLVGIYSGTCTDKLGTKYDITGYSIGATAIIDFGIERKLEIKSAHTRVAVGTYYGSSFQAGLFFGAVGAFFGNVKKNSSLTITSLPVIAGASLEFSKIKITRR